MKDVNKEVLEYVVGLAEPRIFEVNGDTFSNVGLTQVKPKEEKTASAFTTRTLSGLVSYLKTNFDESKKLIVHVVNPAYVKVFSPLNGEKNRDEIIKVEALLPSILFDCYHEIEDFNILLQSSFVDTENRALALKVVGNVKEENVQSYGDDGISQTVQAKAGVAMIAQVVVPNPIVLKPFRTFVEVDQPESNFVLRLKDGPSAALFEADGGAWRNEAMNNIHNFLATELEPLVKEGSIVILA